MARRKCQWAGPAWVMRRVRAACSATMFMLNWRVPPMVWPAWVSAARPVRLVGTGIWAAAPPSSASPPATAPGTSWPLGRWVKGGQRAEGAQGVPGVDVVVVAVGLAGFARVAGGALGLGAVVVVLCALHGGVELLARFYRWGRAQGDG